MNENERSGDLFERLCLLRSCYPLRSPFDSMSVLTVAEAVAHGERLMRIGRWQERRTWERPTRRLA